MSILSDLVHCAVCNKETRQITAAHLRTHGITMTEYKERFPGHPILSDAAKAKLSSDRKGKPRDPEIIRKMHAGRDAAPKRHGYSHSEDTKRKISAKALGRKLTDSHKQAIAAAGIGRKHHAETIQKMRDHHASLTADERALRRARTIATWEEKYGDIAQRDPDVITKMQATNITRYGGISPTSSPEIIAKVKARWLENYPDHGHPQHDPLVRKKIEETCIERYGKGSTTHIARQAFLDANDGLNPFQMAEVKRKIVFTLMEKYGNDVRHPTQIPGHVDKVRTTSVERYGAGNHSQKHIAAENLLILRDADGLRDLVDNYPLRVVGEMLGVSETTVAKRCDLLGIVRLGTSIERGVMRVLEDCGVAYSMRNRRTIAPMELDFVIPERRIAIEVGGIYWHSDKFLAPSYHIRKHELAKAAGYRLLTIFEDEILDNLDIVGSRIRYMMGVGERGVGARNLTIEPISPVTANAFFDLYHIQGGSPNNSHNFGAFLQSGELVAAMSFKKSWRLSHHDDDPFELSRFATDGKNYPGVASRLMRYFVDEFEPNRIVTYADLRWSEGDLYEKMGFTRTRTSRPSYTYVAPGGRERQDKSRFRKQSIEHLVPDGTSKTESQIMNELGYARVYDCGTVRYDWVP